MNNTRGLMAAPDQFVFLLDDTSRLLTAMKRVWGDRLTTVFPRQGYYALDPHAITARAAVERIGELVNVDFAALLGGDNTIT